MRLIKSIPNILIIYNHSLKKLPLVSVKKKETIRNITWDYAKGIAIVMIVFHHLYPRFYIDSNFYPNSIVYLICYTCQLPIFMYVSGLFAKNSINKYGIIDLIKNRAIRLLLPFISFVFIWSFIDPDRFPSIILLENFKGGYWFTFVLFEMMVLLSISKWLAESKKINSLYIIAFVFVMLTVLKIIVPEKKNVINGFFSLNLLWHYFPYFILGYYSNKIKRVFQIRYAVVAAIVYAISIIVLQQTKSHSIIPICNISSLLLAITIFNKSVRPFERLFSIIGVYSLQIYLLHFFSSLFTNHISMLENPIEEFILDAVMTTILVSTCIIVAKIIMKNEILALFLFGIKRKRVIMLKNDDYK